MGETLHPHGKKTSKRRHYFNKAACAKCPHLASCTNDKRGFRSITRGEYADIYEDANRTFDDHLELYKLRKQIVEHPFGTVKYSMNGGHFLLRRRRKVRCEVALLFLGYNLKRAYNVLGFREIMARLNSILLHLGRFGRFPGLKRRFFLFFNLYVIAPRC